MKKLYILRHAKSSWENPNLADFERPLNERGLKTADFMGEYIKEHNFEPDVILSSPAARAKETANIVKKTANLQADLKFEENIYEASLPTLVRLVSEINEKFGRVLLVGHNPGLENLVRFLTGEAHSMPTAGLAIVELDVSKWSEINENCGVLQKLIRPKLEMK